MENINFERTPQSILYGGPLPILPGFEVQNVFKTVNVCFCQLTVFIGHPVAIDPPSKTIPEQITPLTTPLGTRVEQ